MYSVLLYRDNESERERLQENFPEYRSAGSRISEEFDAMIFCPRFRLNSRLLVLYVSV